MSRLQHVLGLMWLILFTWRSWFCLHEGIDFVYMKEFCSSYTVLICIYKCCLWNLSEMSAIVFLMSQEGKGRNNILVNVKLNTIDTVNGYIIENDVPSTVSVQFITHARWHSCSPSDIYVLPLKLDAKIRLPLYIVAPTTNDPRKVMSAYCSRWRDKKHVLPQVHDVLTIQRALITARRHVLMKLFLSVSLDE